MSSLNNMEGWSLKCCKWGGWKEEGESRKTGSSYTLLEIGILFALQSKRLAPVDWPSGLLCGHAWTLHSATFLRIEKGRTKTGKLLFSLIVLSFNLLDLWGRHRLCPTLFEFTALESQDTKKRHGEMTWNGHKVKAAVHLCIHTNIAKCSIGQLKAGPQTTTS